MAVSAEVGVGADVSFGAGVWGELPHGFTALAPMEGVTDLAFRQVIAEAGRPDLFFTEFTNVSSFASERGRANALERLRIAVTDAPIIAQIWGRVPEHFAELAAALEGLGFAGLDINMGCPDRHVNATGGGAAMIRTPELAVECLRQARAATRLPVSVKTRLGYTYVEEWRTWLATLLSERPAALTVHLRTRKEMSKVPAHFELIDEVVALRDEICGVAGADGCCADGLPLTKLVINGDIKDLRQVRELTVAHPGVDGWMIGRGVFENPYCFTEHEPTVEDLMRLFRKHLDLAEEYKLKFDPLKHYFKIYVRGFAGASELRTKLMECRSVAEAREVLEDTFS